MIATFFGDTRNGNSGEDRLRTRMDKYQVGYFCNADSKET